jgi:hypothetical protein
MVTAKRIKYCLFYSLVFCILVLIEPHWPLNTNVVTSQFFLNGQTMNTILYSVYGIDYVITQPNQSELQKIDEHFIGGGIVINIYSPSNSSMFLGDSFIFFTLFKVIFVFVTFFLLVVSCAFYMCEKYKFYRNRIDYEENIVNITDSDMHDIERNDGYQMYVRS